MVLTELKEKYRFFNNEIMLSGIKDTLIQNTNTLNHITFIELSLALNDLGKPIYPDLVLVDEYLLDTEYSDDEILEILKDELVRCVYLYDIDNKITYHFIRYNRTMHWMYLDSQLHLF